MSLIIAVDFDGTVVEHAFPDVGQAMPDALRVLRRRADYGHRLVLWTCREDEISDDDPKEYLTAAVDYLSDNNIVLRSANENHTDDEFRSRGGRKVFANIYIDDRNLGGFPGRLEIERIAEKEGWL